MALPTALNDREYRKFEEVDGEPAVRITGGLVGEIRPSGLNVGGRVSEVTVNSASWTAVPNIPLANRNAIAIQNLSGVEVKLNFSTAPSGYVGMVIADGSERTYDITDSIVIYVKSSSGTAVLNVEEIA